MQTFASIIDRKSKIQARKKSSRITGINKSGGNFQIFVSLILQKTDQSRAMMREIYSLFAELR